MSKSWSHVRLCSLAHQNMPANTNATLQWFTVVAPPGVGSCHCILFHGKGDWWTFVLGPVSGQCIAFAPTGHHAAIRYAAYL